MRHVTREEMREVDRAAIEEYEMPGVILMENAGRGAAACALEMVGESTGPVAVVCGSGNNGGDGYVVARHLHNQGVGVTVHLLWDREKIRGDADTNLAIIEHMGLDIRRTRPDELNLSGAALVVDAVFGTGLSGEVREPYDEAIRAINGARVPVLAVDLPSGLDANSGEVLGVCVTAERTATFALPKVGFTRGSGPERTGEVTVVDIGVPREILE
ncbi:MAG: NAD(P)H-hydrate epimerase [Planctomycetota bacterium]